MFVFKLKNIVAHSIFATSLVFSVWGLPQNAQSAKYAATLPAGFAVTQISNRLANVTAMAISSDNRIFIAQQEGTVRLVDRDVLLSTPVIKVNASPDWERGLTGIVLDPNFASNGYIYVSYTVAIPKPRHRISRFKVVGNTAALTSEIVIFELDDLIQNLHIGGGLLFGLDNKLYITSGEANGGDPQSLNTTGGKILRINSDGSIPTDNPFYFTTSGKYRAIFAVGFRNPFTLALNPRTGRIYVNDVGNEITEEVDELVAGGNYGWPLYEGYSPGPYINPLYTYGHALNTSEAGCAVVGGAFYAPVYPQFSQEYIGQYYFSDYCNDWIRMLDPEKPQNVKLFATNLSGFAIVNMQVGPDGAIYLLSRGVTNSTQGFTVYETGALYKIFYSATSAPSIVTHPQDKTISVGSATTFKVIVSGETPLTYQWQKNGVNIPGAIGDTYSTPIVSVSDNGSRFRVVVSNRLGVVSSYDAVLTVLANKPPVPVINLPFEGSKVGLGEVVRFSGSATDDEVGVLPASALSWSVRMMHGTHSHPVLLPVQGIASGVFTIPRDDHTPNEIFYRIYLDANDGTFTGSTYRDIYPREQSAPPQNTTNAANCTSVTNYLTNAGFEEYTSGWDVWDENTTQIVANKRSGSRALQIGSFNGGIGQRFYVNQGDQHVAVGWVQLGFGSPGGRMGVTYFNEKWEQVGSDATVSIPASSTKYISYTLQTTAPTNAAIGVVWLQKPNSTGYLYADDVCVARTRGSAVRAPIESNGFMRLNSAGKWEWFGVTTGNVGTETHIPLIVLPRQ
jgi:glucose/arabinose dehydrogenase